MLDLSNQMFFEDIPVGYHGQGLSRTIDYCDVVNYANFTRDYNPIHTDRESSKKSLIGDIMAHGYVGIMIASGMMLRTEFGTKTLKTLLECKRFGEVKFLSPLLMGDTLTLHFEVVDKQDFDDTKGLIEMKFEAFNQKGQLAQRHTRTYLVAKKGYDFEGISQRGCW